MRSYPDSINLLRNKVLIDSRTGDRHKREIDPFFKVAAKAVHNMLNKQALLMARA